MSQADPPTIYQQLVALEEASVPFVLVTLVESTGSVPQDVGAKMLVTAEGLHAGTIGGGRVEAKAILHCISLLDTKSAPSLLSWTLKTDVGMTCGGIVKLFFEPHYASPWSIAIFGAGHIAQALVPVLLPLDCHLTVFDTRSEWVAKLPISKKLRPVETPDLANAVDDLPDGAFILCMTQGHSCDLPVLQRALTSGRFPFIGVIGSDAKSAVLRRDLLESGIDPALAETFHCPVGLDFGSNHPHEIALSIAAQLLTERDRIKGC